MPRGNMRLLVRIGLSLAIAFVAVTALVYFKQHAFVYHPRPYDSSYSYMLPANGEELHYTLPIGEQIAFYIPATNGQPLPRRIWFAFCGNGSLALDWINILSGYQNSDEAFVLIDYPGYGRCAGYATIPTTRASVDEALRALATRLHLSEEDLERRLCTIGHSLGSAVALDFAARHRIQRVLAIAPFTTLREEAARIVGGPLSFLLIESYDNRSAIDKIRDRNPEARIAIFHGTNDEVIPIWMGRELAQRYPWVEFHPVSGAGHVSVLNVGRQRIVQWMSE